MKTELLIAFRNLFRHPRRTFLTMGAIAFAVLVLIFMLSFQFGSYETMINASVKIRTGHLQIRNRDYAQNQEIRYMIPSPLKIIRKIKTVPSVEAVTQRASGQVLLSAFSEKNGERTYGALLQGIVPADESAVSTLPTLIRQGDYLSDSNGYEILLGHLLASNLKVSVGDEVTLLGQGHDGSVAASVLTVKGIFKTGMSDADRIMAQMPLSGFQDIFSLETSVHNIVVNVHSLDDIARVKQQLQQMLSETDGYKDIIVSDWKELMPGLMQSIKLDLISGMIMYLILIIVVAFSILNTFLMAILERTREFGVMTAIGTTQVRLFRLVMTESLFLTLIGIFIGLVTGVCLTAFFQVHGIDITGASEILEEYGIKGRMYPKLSITSVSVGPLAVLLITLFAALFPALKLIRLKPVEAMTFR